MFDFCCAAVDLSRFLIAVAATCEIDYSNDSIEEESETHNDIQQECHDDDIRREYHPNAHREPEVFRFDDYQSTPPVFAPPVEPEPWLLFKMREDFEFAEIALATAMTKSQVDATIDLLHRCIDKGKGSFTLSNHEEMRRTLKVASDRLPKVGLGSSQCHFPTP